MSGPLDGFLEQQWRNFDEIVLPPGILPGQRAYMRRAFYAGALTLFAAAKTSAESLPQDAALDALDSLASQLREFGQAIDRGES